DIAVFNATGVNGGVEPNSEITFNDWYSVMPYADMIIVTPMTGQQIKEMVMSNAQRIVRPEEVKGDNVLGFISRGFLHFSKALRYTIKLNSDATSTIAQDITLKGEPINSVLDKTFNVAFSDYIALRGSEGWHGEKVGHGLPDDVIGFDIASLPKNDTGLVYRNEIIVYIKENGILDDSTGAVKDGRVQVIP
ncbi:MAG: 5'-nucleotidase C-terminal domain-containing protein, partial [Candidatus Parabeggiatoa sp.]|nr:5'-nucleotidase C-terminal domain-containing protein [Candidatus Parabeggiatoa sp.]